MAEESYKFFCNKKCVFFPCHRDVDPENFNCLFCYCPLYSMGDRCGGNFSFTPEGIKDCTDCPFPHFPDNYNAVLGKLEEEMAAKIK